MNRLRVARLACLVLIATTLSVLPFAGATAAPAAEHATQTAAAPAAQAGKGGKKVHWSGTTYTEAAPAQITAQGKLKRKGKHKVMLQVKSPSGWRTFARSKSQKSGKFQVSGTLAWFGTHKVRVHSGRFNKSKKVHVQTSWAPRGKASWHKFLKQQGHQLFFNPCQTIRYQVDYSKVGETGLQLVQQAMAQVSWVTGIKVKYAGTTSRIPFSSNKAMKPKGGTDLLIAYADSTQVPQFAGSEYGGLAGLGGQLWAHTGRTKKGHKAVWRTALGGVSINSEMIATGTLPMAWDGTQATLGQVLLHEVGHAFGLQHVNHADQLMYKQNGVPDTDGLFHARFSLGDFTGLQKAGLDHGCIKKAVWNRRGGRVPTGIAPPPQPAYVSGRN